MKNIGFCNITLRSDGTKILEFNQYQKRDKAPFIIYAHVETLIEKIDGCTNNPKKSPLTKAIEPIPLGFSVSSLSSFRIIESTHGVYRDKNFMKTF